MNDPELERLQAGQQVEVYERPWSGGEAPRYYRTETVLRLTNSHVVTKNGRYSLRTGVLAMGPCAPEASQFKIHTIIDAK